MIVYFCAREKFRHLSNLLEANSGQKESYLTFGDQD